MNTPEKRGIGLNQTVPVLVLTEALSIVLRNGELTREDMFEVLSHHPHGTNRTGKLAEKTTKIFRSSVTHLAILKTIYEDSRSAALNKTELKYSAIALTAIAYPAIYHLLVILAEQFRVQETVSRSFINKMMADLYGGNRATALGVDAMIPILVDSGFIERKKMGQYKIGGNLTPPGPGGIEFWLYTDFVLSEARTILSADVAHRPWSDYCPGIQYSLKNFRVLQTEIMSGTGEIIVYDGRDRE